MDLVEQIHIFDLINIHTFGPDISLIRLFSLMLNYAKPQLIWDTRFLSNKKINKNPEVKWLRELLNREQSVDDFSLCFHRGTTGGITVWWI